MGLLPPVGFWDPLEFARYGSKGSVLQRCALKIEHGRFPLQACIGDFVRGTRGSAETVKALQLLFHTLESQVETDTPHMLYKATPIGSPTSRT